MTTLNDNIYIYARSVKTWKKKEKLYLLWTHWSFTVYCVLLWLSVDLLSPLSVGLAVLLLPLPFPLPLPRIPEKQDTGLVTFFLFLPDEGPGSSVSVSLYLDSSVKWSVTSNSLSSSSITFPSSSLSSIAFNTSSFACSAVYLTGRRPPVAMTKFQTQQKHNGAKSRKNMIKTSEKNHYSMQKPCVCRKLGQLP